MKVKASVRSCPLIQDFLGYQILSTKAPSAVVEQMLDGSMSCKLDGNVWVRCEFWRSNNSVTR